MELRFAGMIIGILVSFASAWVPFEALGLPGLFGPFGVGIAGAPVAALLGWCLSPSIVSGSWRRAAAIGVGAGLLAAPLGLLELLYVAGLGGLAFSPEGIGETAGGWLSPRSLGWSTAGSCCRSRSHPGSLRPWPFVAWSRGFRRARRTLRRSVFATPSSCWRWSPSGLPSSRSARSPLRDRSGHPEIRTEYAVDGGEQRRPAGRPRSSHDASALPGRAGVATV